MKICRKWTNTECETAIDIPSPSKYAKMKAVDASQIDGTIEEEELDDYSVIEAFPSERQIWDYQINVKEEASNKLTVRANGL